MNDTFTHLDLYNEEIMYYFHNTSIPNTLLHLHVRTKKNLNKIRHLLNGYILLYEYTLVHDLDKTLMYLINNIDFKDKLYYTHIGKKETDILNEINKHHTHITTSTHAVVPASFPSSPAAVPASFPSQPTVPATLHSTSPPNNRQQ